MERPRLFVHARYLAALVTMALIWQCQARASAEGWGVDKERLRVSDSTVTALRKDSAALAVQLVRLRADSGQLARQAEQLQADFRHELRRWNALIAGWQQLAGHVDTVLVTPQDSLPPIDEVIRQANATIASCRSAFANCEARALNAEQRVVATDSLWRNAESRASQFLQQADIWRRKAQPSLWEQFKQIPGRIMVPATVAGVTWAACQLGGSE